MSKEPFWQAKIWGLLHDPALKALHDHTGRGREGFWEIVPLMEGWQSPKESGKTIFEHIGASDLIASASDRAILGNVPSNINYAPRNQQEKGLEICHLLSGEKLSNWKFAGHEELIQQSNRREYLVERESSLIKLLSAEIEALQQETVESNKVLLQKKLFWKLWRCWPIAICRAFNDDSLMLMPADTRLPDASIWSHNSITAALAGALAGYNLTSEELEARWNKERSLSHAYMAIFSFTPVQELIKSSRKMRDFWAGSWLLHYLSAKVCWELAKIYGPDSFLYPSLFDQPLIDEWLLQEYPDFQEWIERPTERQLLTAGFPNVIVLVLPKERVEAAMQTARQLILTHWKELGNSVFEQLQNQRHWMSDLKAESSSWDGWLKAQWQTYWTALPIGKEGENLKSSAIPIEREQELQNWLDALNKGYKLNSEQQLFYDEEIDFMRASYQYLLEQRGRRFSVNIGSWWPFIFDRLRYSLSAVKNSRTWQIPTAFGPRSTISGLGPVVHPDEETDWIVEGETKKLWRHHAGLFDGREQLNATETVKRALHKILPNLLGRDSKQLAAAYPDLSSGLAGYLKKNGRLTLEHFHRACQSVLDLLRQDRTVQSEDLLSQDWGIPWIDEHQDQGWHRYNPRFIHAGWLVEELEIPEEERVRYRNQLSATIAQFYPYNNPTDWYVLAAGDGDGMSQWLKGEKMQPYRTYIPSELKVTEPLNESFEKFLSHKKRMGPATHNALSRALLDFSNQLLPYLTEKRYAGRLIYGGGDDVLAYTNLWEWDEWLHDIRECFRGDKDPKNEFRNEGDYWQWQQGKTEPPSGLASRPLFTMGRYATISFGITIAHQSVPLAIALENLWAAEDAAKKHRNPNGEQKDAVQIRLLYGNGNILEATAKFDVFYRWQSLLNYPELDSALFEQAAAWWSEHPAPVLEAINSWTALFCIRRETFKTQVDRDRFQEHLTEFLECLYSTTEEQQRDREINNWLKLAAFMLRNRQIALGGQL
ncbi:type III-B CRISPR-associated protein Cas10/Cmr2 [Oxynema sp. CENA135]|uniref:type III-B CRISPR-associated protein Cas10/Cmr2 n=1 Tax=Oxynema sp. CENA135 TaxID=984206 RepID=UPI001909750C|nr:type III-B CRISPR-associated protein Cas10/Cmr2 [Oxynema sp. CENA135]MBK4728549.1 type III-B CRISPR-associated protein Cas10/Cmr2 [Oxynema sp. CENA135]